MLGLSYPLEECVGPSVLTVGTLYFIVVTLLGVKFMCSKKLRAYHKRYKGFKKYVDRPINRQTGQQMNIYIYTHTYIYTQNEGEREKSSDSMNPGHITE
jgi:hypothetical protein